MGRNLADRCTNEVNASMLQSQQEIIGNIYVYRFTCSFFFISLVKKGLLFSFKDFVKCETIFYCFFLNVVILFFLENLKPLLPAGIQNKLHTLIPCRKFDLSYDLNCHKLCSDFQEDIVFRFSLGWSSLVHRFLGPTNAQRVLLGLSEPIFQVIFFFELAFH